MWYEWGHLKTTPPVCHVVQHTKPKTNFKPLKFVLVYTLIDENSIKNTLHYS